MASQYKLSNQAMHDPARTAKLGEEALEAAKAEQLSFGAKIDQIKRYILEKGWNWIEIGGKRIYVPIHVAPAEKIVTQVGWHLRVYGIGPYGMGGWHNQSKVGGTPDPIVFTLDDNGKSKTYVASGRLRGQRPVEPGRKRQAVLQAPRKPPEDQTTRLRVFR